MTGMSACQGLGLFSSLTIMQAAGTRPVVRERVHPSQLEPVAGGHVSLHSAGRMCACPCPLEHLGYSLLLTMSNLSMSRAHADTASLGICLDMQSLGHSVDSAFCYHQILFKVVYQLISHRKV